jgi:hypothetical protein
VTRNGFIWIRNFQRYGVRRSITRLLRVADAQGTGKAPLVWNELRCSCALITVAGDSSSTSKFAGSRPSFVRPAHRDQAGLTACEPGLVLQKMQAPPTGLVVGAWVGRFPAARRHIGKCRRRLVPTAWRGRKWGQIREMRVKRRCERRLGILDVPGGNGVQRGTVARQTSAPSRNASLGGEFLRPGSVGQGLQASLASMGKVTDPAITRGISLYASSSLRRSRGALKPPRDGSYEQCGSILHETIV